MKKKRPIIPRLSPGIVSAQAVAIAAAMLCAWCQSGSEPLFPELAMLFEDPNVLSLWRNSLLVAVVAGMYSIIPGVLSEVGMLFIIVFTTLESVPFQVISSLHSVAVFLHLAFLLLAFSLAGTTSLTLTQRMWDSLPCLVDPFLELEGKGLPSLGLGELTMDVLRNFFILLLPLSGLLAVCTAYLA